MRFCGHLSCPRDMGIGRGNGPWLAAASGRRDRWANTPGTGTVLGFGFLVLAALQTGRVFATLRLPRLTGYLLCGLAAFFASMGTEIVAAVASTAHSPRLAELPTVLHEYDVVVSCTASSLPIKSCPYGSANTVLLVPRIAWLSVSLPMVFCADAAS